MFFCWWLWQCWSKKFAQSDRNVGLQLMFVRSLELSMVSMVLSIRACRDNTSNIQHHIISHLNTTDTTQQQRSSHTGGRKNNILFWSEWPRLPWFLPANILSQPDISLAWKQNKTDIPPCHPQPQITTENKFYSCNFNWVNISHFCTTLCSCCDRSKLLQCLTINFKGHLSTLSPPQC